MSAKIKQIIFSRLKEASLWKFKCNNTNGRVLKNIHTLTKLPCCEATQMVFQVNQENKYVIKFVQLHDQNKLEEFLNEVTIGLLKNVSKFGVNVHAYTIDTHNMYGIYLMDHVTFGKDINFATMWTFMNFVSKTKHQYETLIKLYYKTLVSFYSITKGFHGDLHENNVIVLYNDKLEPVEVKIIDYGMFLKFRRSNHFDPTHQPLSVYLQRVQSTFNNFKSAYSPSIFQGTVVKYFNTGRPVRSNRNLLKPYLKNFKQIEIKK